MTEESGGCIGGYYRQMTGAAAIGIAGIASERVGSLEIAGDRRRSLEIAADRGAPRDRPDLGSAAARMQKLEPVLDQLLKGTRARLVRCLPMFAHE